MRFLLVSILIVLTTFHSLVAMEKKDDRQQAERFAQFMAAYFTEISDSTPAQDQSTSAAPDKSSYQTFMQYLPTGLLKLAIPGACIIIGSVVLYFRLN